MPAISDSPFQNLTGFAMFRQRKPMHSRIILFLFVLCAGCSIYPGSMARLKRKGIDVTKEDFTVTLHTTGQKRSHITYLGCGGIHIVNGDASILIDPFFSNQSAFRIGRSIFGGRSGKATLKPSGRMLELGINAIRNTDIDNQELPDVIVNAHSHYDHLMDIPSVYNAFNKEPRLLLTNSGFNICHALVDSTDVTLLDPIAHQRGSSDRGISIVAGAQTIRVYPIFSEHNPHLRSIKFFSGDQSKPVADFTDPMSKTSANLWLEGNTFTFLIDFIDKKGNIELRFFVQSSSCNAPAGIPPAELLAEHPVDLAFVGIASHGFSPDYPCELLEALKPSQVVWIHWEDFFRPYNRPPKTLRGTDIPAFFQKPCVAAYKNTSKMMWPRVKMSLVY
jgi:hypothetical protein